MLLGKSSIALLCSFSSSRSCGTSQQPHGAVNKLVQGAHLVYGSEFHH
jgi:hypothetical protein